MSAIVTAILAFFAPIIKDIATDVIKQYLTRKSYEVVEKTANVIKPEAVHTVYNPAEHIDKYDRLLDQD